MLFERFEARGLAHYSYVVGCPAAGEAVVVDPRRDVDVYLELAARKGLRVTAVLETHVHADYASGARELGERTGADVAVSAYDAGEEYQVAFPHRDLEEGDELEIGSVRIEALHTPGHTPEHLSYLVYDGARSREVPEILLSGDFLFVGSLGRPDLLGEAATLELAREMYRSVREKLEPLPDGLEVHPAHGAGSMCGSGMGGRPSSTLGFERVANPYLDPDLTREAFVERLVGDVPPFPPYYRRMKRLNAEGPPPAEASGARPLDVDAFRREVEGGAVVVDAREPLAFGGGHVPGAFGIGAGPSLSTWAAWVVPPDRPIVLVLPDAAESGDAVRRLVRVGLDDVRGFLEGGMDAWIAAGHPFEETPQVSARQLAAALERNEGLRVLDVRTESEYAEGHVEGAIHVMGGFLEDHLDELRDGDAPVAVMCATGYRSTVAASVLQRAGFRAVRHVSGGMDAWERAGLPVVRGERRPAGVSRASGR